MQGRRFTSFCLLALYTGKAQVPVTSQLTLWYIRKHHLLFLMRNFVLYVEVCIFIQEYTFCMCTGVRYTHTHTHTTVTVALLSITILLENRYNSTVHEMWGQNVSTRNRSSSSSLYLAYTIWSAPTFFRLNFKCSISSTKTLHQQSTQTLSYHISQ